MEALAVLGGLIALDVLAVRYGCDTRDGIDGAEFDRWRLWHERTAGREKGARAVFDPFTAEMAGRYRQAQLLDEAARARLLREAGVRRPALTRALRAGLYRAGMVLVAAGAWLQSFGDAAEPAGGSLEAAPQW